MLFALSPASLGLQPSNLIAVCKDTVYFITAEKPSQTKITGREGKKTPFLISIFIHILTVKYPNTLTFKTPSSQSSVSLTPSGSELNQRKKFTWWAWKLAKEK